MSDQERNELLKQVIEIQNRPANRDRDILTITGFFTTRDEFARHIADMGAVS